MRAFFQDSWDVAARLAAAAAAFMGGGNLRALCLLMIMDYVLGVSLALLGKSTKTPDGRLSARASFKGLLQKATMLGVIFLAAALDRIAGQADLLRRAAVGFYICNEAISLLENAARLGIPIPAFLRRALSTLNKNQETPAGNIR